MENLFSSRNILSCDNYLKEESRKPSWTTEITSMQYFHFEVDAGAEGVARRVRGFLFFHCESLVELRLPSHSSALIAMWGVCGGLAFGGRWVADAKLWLLLQRKKLCSVRRYVDFDVTDFSNIQEQALSFFDCFEIQNFSKKCSISDVFFRELQSPYFHFKIYMIVVDCHIDIF
jgi:hypothetical protein